MAPADFSAPYEHNAATAGAVRASGQTVSTTAGSVQELDESVRAGHAPAPAGVERIDAERLSDRRDHRRPGDGVAFSSLGTPPATAPDPTTMDIGGAHLPLDEALDELAASRRALDIRSSAADDWYREAAGADGSDRVESPWLLAEVGYLTVEVQGRYNPLSDDAVVAHVLSW